MFRRKKKEQTPDATASNHIVLDLPYPGWTASYGSLVQVKAKEWLRKQMDEGTGKR